MSAGRDDVIRGKRRGGKIQYLTNSKFESAYLSLAVIFRWHLASRISVLVAAVLQTRLIVHSCLSSHRKAKVRLILKDVLQKRGR